MKRKLSRVWLFFLTVPVLMFIYLPVSYLLLTSVSTRAELLSVPIHWIPENPTFKNYIDILTPGTATSEVARTFKVTLRNSLLVASSVTVISLVFGSMAAYALSRIRVPFRNTMLLGIMGTRMIPEVSLVIPLYILAVRVGL